MQQHLDASMTGQRLRDSNAVGVLKRSGQAQGLC